MEFTYVFLIALIVLAVVFVKKSVIIIPQSETKIVERLGKYFATLKPGINIIIPFIDRAKEIVKQLSENDITEKVQSIAIDTKGDVKARKTEHFDEVDMAQISLFDTVTDEDVIKEIKEANLSVMTPIDALNTLYRLQSKLLNRWQTPSKKNPE